MRARKLLPGSLAMFRGCSSIVALGMGNFSAGGRPFAPASVPVEAGGRCMAFIMKL